MAGRLPPQVTLSSDLTAGEEGDKPPAPAPAPGLDRLSVPTQVKSNIGINNPLNTPRSLSVPTGGGCTGNPRNKVSLRPGFSLMDWVRLTKSGRDLSGVGGPLVGGRPREVTRRELAQHKTRRDAWMALNGLVYNVTDYMDYHPGGWDELVRGAGRDATQMFNEIHKWVNYQGMLEACLVGKLVDTPAVPPSSSKPSKPRPPPALLPPPLPPIPTKPSVPAVDFFQTAEKITVNIYTKVKGLGRERVVVDCNPSKLTVTVRLPEGNLFCLQVELHRPVVARPVLRVLPSSGKTEVDLVKAENGRWVELGGQEAWLGPASQRVTAAPYRDWSVTAISQATPTVKLLQLAPPPGLLQTTPPGHHLELQCSVGGVTLSRPYTPVPALALRPAPAPLQLLVRVYPTGAVTPVLGALQPGDTVQVGEPEGSWTMSRLAGKTSLFLLCGGTGITPAISLLPALAALPSPLVTSFLTCHTSQQEEIWGDELRTYAATQPWLDVATAVSSAGQRLSHALLSAHLPPGPARLAAVCGPPGFNREAVRILREEMAFCEDDIHVFDG